MSRRERLIVEVIDDLDRRGGLDTPADQSFTLALNTRAVKIDLTDEHAKELTEFLRPYLEAGEKIALTAAGVPRNVSTMAAARKRNVRIQQWGLEHQRADIREWAAQAIAGGHRSNYLVRAYEAAHPEDPRP